MSGKDSLASTAKDTDSSAKVRANNTQTSVGRDVEMVPTLASIAEQQFGEPKLMRNGMRPEMILRLQRKVGNQAVQRMLNGQLTGNGIAPKTIAAQTIAAREMGSAGRNGAHLQREGDVKGAAAGGGSGTAKTTTYPGESAALAYMENHQDTKVQKDWAKFKQMAKGRGVDDILPLLAHYCYGLASVSNDDDRAAVRGPMEGIAERIAIIFKQRGMYSIRTGGETDEEKTQKLIKKGDVKNFYFWSLTMNEAFADSTKNEGTTLEGSAAGSLFNDPTFAHGNYAGIYRIIFEKMSSHYADTAAEIIQKNAQDNPDTTSVIKILQYRGINADSAFAQEEWDRIKKSGLPYEFSIYLRKGTPSAWGKAPPAFQSPEFTAVSFHPQVEHHYTMDIGTGGLESPPRWNFLDGDNDPFNQGGGLHVNGTGPAEPGHKKPSKRFSALPAAFLGSKLLGKTDAGQLFHLDPTDGSPKGIYAMSEESALNKHKQGK